MRKKYQEIVVAYDGSNRAQQALSEALEIAHRNEAAITLLQVIEEDPKRTDSLKLAEKSREVYTASLENEVNRVKNRHPEIKVMVQVLFGSPKREITKFCQNIETVGLVVLGDTGTNKARHSFVGSTASYISDHVECNVMIVK